MKRGSYYRRSPAPFWLRAAPMLILFGAIAVFHLVESQKRERALQLAGPDAYYSRCAEARAAGVAPLYFGEPGYRDGLDGDGDGIACEPPR